MFTTRNPKKNILRDRELLAKCNQAGYSVALIKEMKPKQIQAMLDNL